MKKFWFKLFSSVISNTPIQINKIYFDGPEEKCKAWILKNLFIEKLTRTFPKFLFLGRKFQEENLPNFFS